MPELILGTDIWPWYFSLTTVGEYEIPVLRKSLIRERPMKMTVLQNYRASSSNSDKTLVHVYTNDTINSRLVKRPFQYFQRISTAASFVSPDLSMYRVLPKVQRIFHTVVNRGVGAVLQSRGIDVIPNIAWSSSQDYSFCFEGVEQNSPVAISSHGKIRDSVDRQCFEHGVFELIERLNPNIVLFYGSHTRATRIALRSVDTLWQFDCDQNQARAQHGYS